MEIHTHSPEETQELARRVVAALAARPGVPGTGTILALEGDLGAGKTTFTKGLAAVLGVADTVTSPTFVLERIYALAPDMPWKHLIHIDAYRLESEAELGALGWHEAVTNPSNLVVIEWPGQVGLGVPERAFWLEFEHVGEGERRIRIDTRLGIT